MKNIKNWLIEYGAKLGLGILSFLTYGFFLGWIVSIFLMLALIVHEYGHLLAMRLTNTKTGGVYLIPFFGGVTVIKEGYRSYWQHTIISLAGPAMGAVLALLFAIYGRIINLPVFEAAAAMTVVFNLFNLMPSLPLDGGHWIKCICFSFKPVTGIIVLSAITGAVIGASIPIFGWWAPAIWLFGIFQLVVEGYYFVKRHDPNYPTWSIPHLLREQPTPLSQRQLVYSVLAYVGICSSLLFTGYLTRDLDISHLLSYFR
jgi:Zn-dependent protease